MWKASRWILCTLSQRYACLEQRKQQEISANTFKGWSDTAKKATYRAIKKAGFNEDRFPLLNDVMFITEPEAGALYAARFLRNEMKRDFLKVCVEPASGNTALKLFLTHFSVANVLFYVMRAAVQWYVPTITGISKCVNCIGCCFVPSFKSGPIGTQTSRDGTR